MAKISSPCKSIWDNILNNINELALKELILLLCMKCLPVWNNCEDTFLHHIKMESLNVMPTAV